MSTDSFGSLVLCLPQTEKAKAVGGYNDPGKPHCVNNMIVGNLGSKEVLLLCCDDGDVMAFYTDKFARHAEFSDSPSMVDWEALDVAPKP